MRRLLAIALLASSIAGCGARKEADRTPAIAPSHRWAARAKPTGYPDHAAEASVELGAEMIRLLDPGPEDNAFVSPLSVSASLAMVALGTRGEVQAAALALLRSDDAAKSADSLSALLAAALRSPDRAFNTASSIWVQDPLRFGEAYKEEVAERLNAAAKSSHPDRLVAEVNDWVRRETLGRIPALVDAPNPLTVAYLVNASTFDASWPQPFVASLTRPEPFHVTEARRVETAMMRGNDCFESATGIRDPNAWVKFKGSEFGAFFVMPKDRSPAAFLAALGEQEWSALAKLPREQAEVSLPRFRLELKYRLSKALGASHPALFRAGDFGPMLAGVPRRAISLGEVFHASTLEFDEQGVKAAAATAAEAEAAAITPIVFNRPFALIVYHVPTNAVAFMGVVANPGTLGTRP